MYRITTFHGTGPNPIYELTWHFGRPKPEQWLIDRVQKVLGIAKQCDGGLYWTFDTIVATKAQTLAILLRIYDGM